MHKLKMLSTMAFTPEQKKTDDSSYSWSVFPPWGPSSKFQRHLSHEKKTLTLLSMKCWLFNDGILLMVYEIIPIYLGNNIIPYILYTINNQVFFIAHLDYRFTSTIIGGTSVVYLVCVWTNPSERYAQVKLDHFLKYRWKSKMFETTT